MFDKLRSSRNFTGLPFDQKLIPLARKNRKRGLLHEVLLWNRLKAGQLNGLDFDRQKVIGSYIVDFFCAEKGVVIEVDGSSHDGTEEQDALRDEFLRSLGLEVIRIPVAAVLGQLSDVIDSLAEHPNLS